MKLRDMQIHVRWRWIAVAMVSGLIGFCALVGPGIDVEPIRGGPIQPGTIGKVTP